MPRRQPRTRTAADAAPADSSASPPTLEARIIALVAPRLGIDAAQVTVGTVICRKEPKEGLDGGAVWMLMEALETALGIPNRLTEMNTVEPLTVQDVVRLARAAGVS